MGYHANAVKIHEWIKTVRIKLEETVITDTMQQLPGYPSIFIRTDNSNSQYAVCFIEYAYEPYVLNPQIISAFVLMDARSGWDDLNGPATEKDSMILIPQSNTIYKSISKPTEEMTRLHKLLWEV